jgi:hypothetical protein
MKKKLLNLSLFLLLSTSSNVFAMLKQGTKAYLTVDGPIKEVTEKLNQATVELLSDGASGATQTSLNRAVDALLKVDDSKLTQISEAVKSGFAKSYNVLTGLLPSRESKIIKSVLDNSTNLKNIIVDFARNNPGTAGAIAVTGAGLCAFGINRLKSKNAEANRIEPEATRAPLQNDDESLLGGGAAVQGNVLQDNEESDESLSGGGAAAPGDVLPTTQIPDVSLLASQNPGDYKQFIDYIIKNNLENEKLTYKHVGDDARTVLMLLAENFWPSGLATTNFPALQYFKSAIDIHNAEQGENPKNINVDIKDNHGRTALFYAAFYGLENIVNFLLDKLNASVTEKDIEAASYKEGFGVDQEETYARYARIKSKLATKFSSQ